MILQHGVEAALAAGGDDLKPNDDAVQDFDPTALAQLIETVIPIAFLQGFQKLKAPVQHSLVQMYIFSTDEFPQRELQLNIQQRLEEDSQQKTGSHLALFCQQERLGHFLGKSPQPMQAERL